MLLIFVFLEFEIQMIRWKDVRCGKFRFCVFVIVKIKPICSVSG